MTIIGNYFYRVLVCFGTGVPVIIGMLIELYDSGFSIHNHFFTALVCGFLSVCTVCISNKTGMKQKSIISVVLYVVKINISIVLYAFILYWLWVFSYSFFESTLANIVDVIGLIMLANFQSGSIVIYLFMALLNLASFISFVIICLLLYYTDCTIILGGKNRSGT